MLMSHSADLDIIEEYEEDRAQSRWEELSKEPTGTECCCCSQSNWMMPNQLSVS